jgi:hypothetical protein
MDIYHSMAQSYTLGYFQLQDIKYESLNIFHDDSISNCDIHHP